MFRYALSGLCAALLASSAFAQSVNGTSTEPDIQGYLCCNMRSDGKSISDINYDEEGNKVLPLGTPAKVTGFGRYRVFTEMAGKRQAIGNDYSRDVNMTAFAQRYIVAEDPQLKLASFAPKIRDAINNAKLVPGMTREQVFMSVGYPVTSENPALSAKLLRFWLDSESEFQVSFDDRDLVKDVLASPWVRTRIVME